MPNHPYCASGGRRSVAPAKNIPALGRHRYSNFSGAVSSYVVSRRKLLVRAALYRAFAASAVRGMRVQGCCALGLAEARHLSAAVKPLEVAALPGAAPGKRARAWCRSPPRRSAHCWAPAKPVVIARETAPALLQPAVIRFELRNSAALRSRICRGGAPP